MKVAPVPGWRCPKCGAAYAETNVKPEDHPCVMSREDPSKAVEHVQLWRCGNCHADWLDERKAEACCAL